MALRKKLEIMNELKGVILKVSGEWTKYLPDRFYMTDYKYRYTKTLKQKNHFTFEGGTSIWKSNVHRLLTRPFVCSSPNLITPRAIFVSGSIRCFHFH